jgi:hypothetical protein
MPNLHRPFCRDTPFVNDLVEVLLDNDRGLGSRHLADGTVIVGLTEELPEHPLDSIKFAPYGSELFGLSFDRRVVGFSAWEVRAVTRGAASRCDGG